MDIGRNNSSFAPWNHLFPPITTEFALAECQGFLMSLQKIEL